MKSILSKKMVRVGAGLAIASLLAGCEKKPDASAELERAANEIQKIEAAAPVVNQPDPTAGQQPAALAPAQEMNQAMVSFKAGNLEDAVTRLQALRATQTLTPGQRIALNDAMAAVMSEIATMAAQGDPRAIQAVKQYEQMRNRSR